jgi:hypothetical protein
LPLGFYNLAYAKGNTIGRNNPDKGRPPDGHIRNSFGYISQVLAPDIYLLKWQLSLIKNIERTILPVNVVSQFYPL